MYQTNQNYLYSKKKALCNKKNTNTLAYPTRIIDLQGVITLQGNRIPDTSITVPPDPQPFYELYTITSLDQSSYPCNINAWKKYVTVVYKKCHK